MASKISGSSGSGGGSTVLSRSLAKIQSLFDEAQDLIAKPPLVSLTSIAIGGIGRVLSDLGVMEALPPKVVDILAEGGVVVEEEIGGGGDGGDDLPSFGIGGKLGMLAALKSSACNSKCSDDTKS